MLFDAGDTISGLCGFWLEFDLCLLSYKLL